MDNKTPYDAGYAGRDCPPAPADEAQAYRWQGAYLTGQSDRAWDDGKADGQAGRPQNREQAGTPGLPSSDAQRKYRAGWRAGRHIYKQEQATVAVAERTGQL